VQLDHKDHKERLAHKERLVLSDLKVHKARLDLKDLKERLELKVL